MITAQELREKYLKFFESKGHTIIPSASLVPRETDTSTLFTTAGMHPLVPFLLGEEHPGGKRVVNVQKCVRTGDIDDVGDNRHLTFFEMMGNWSFGDYFKREAIEWSFEFLTSKRWLGLDPKRLYVTTFKGENNIPRDEDAVQFWQAIFAQNNLENGAAGDDEIIKNDIRIIPLGTDDNFWIAGATGPCGGDTEMFYDTRPEEGNLNGKFSDLVKSGRLLEIWNDVFMEFNKTENGQYEKLAKPNVDTGMGVERTLAVLNGKENVFETELFQPIFVKISKISDKNYADYQKEFRIVADHIKAAVFMVADGVTPLNVDRGYVLRRLIRRAVRYGKLLGIEKNFTKQLATVVIEIYHNFYQELESNRNIIFTEMEKEENKFRQTLEKGLKEFEILEKIDYAMSKSPRWISGESAFELYQTYGFPLEMFFEELDRRDIKYDKEKIIADFSDKMKKHQDLSRTASSGAFKGGLQSIGEMETKYHTATHLLLAALREVLGTETFQKGSNINAERLRFDFNSEKKITAEQLQKVENLVNQKIQEKIPVEMIEMSRDEALKLVKISCDPIKYGERVKVYSISDFSIELCGGPHVKNTGDLKYFKIIKEEASSAGVRRIKAILKQTNAK